MSIVPVPSPNARPSEARGDVPPAGGFLSGPRRIRREPRVRLLVLLALAALGGAFAHALAPLGDDMPVARTSTGAASPAAPPPRASTLGHCDGDAPRQAGDCAAPAAR